MHHFYEIILAKKGHGVFSEKEMYLGPVILSKKTNTIIEKWKWQQSILKDILKNLNPNNDKYKTIAKQYQWLKEELDESPRRD